ncbi:MAG: flavin reductase [Oscillospiraceae bacterium]|jgi:flavorubredoxin/flavin reductase (DIM6/NTAB) family NADH-FMN oxidoreductase RutF/rubredoxin|nr:flavin reductase [Oscillospiraceae bacterium]
MRCIKKITDDLFWIGANDRRLAMFEGVYSVPKGVSYNSYLLTDEKTVLFDTADKAVKQRFLENLAAALNGKSLDYFVIQHMEPDHSAAIEEILSLYPDVKVVCNVKILAFIEQFHGFSLAQRAITVKEGDVLKVGKHELNFIMAPMVHWPEVMVTFDSTDNILFSADAFGCFGALNGALFADEVDFERDYMVEARRYYTNIVGKYGQQVQTLLNKASAFKIDIICPLHGFVWRDNINGIISKYLLWSSYAPEENGVVIAYASVYGNTENAAEILSVRLREKGVKTEMFDVSVTPSSEIVSAAFKFSHLVFASTTYNAGIFVSMEEFVGDLCAHNIQNRTVAIIENGSWAATSGGLIREKLAKCKNIKILDKIISIKSSLKEEQLAEIDAMAQEIAADFPAERSANSGADSNSGLINPAVMFKLSYGLYVLTARDGNKDNGCIINTVTQITASPIMVSIAVNKSNYTNDIISKTGEFNVSVLSESVPFSVFERFGFAWGRDTDKFAGCAQFRSANGIRYVPEHANAVISAKVVETKDCGSHNLYLAEVTQTIPLSEEPSVTYQYYFDNIKPKPPLPKEKKKGFVCKICGYIHEGDELPADFVCPLCKHGAQDFERI